MNAVRFALQLSILGVGLVFFPVYSQGLDGRIMPRPTRLVEKESLQIDIKGAMVEVIRDKSVNERALASGDIIFEVVTRSQDVAELSVTNPVLIFNHGLGEYGFVTGEIAIKFRRSEDIRSFPTSEFLKFSKVGNLDVYTVQASSSEQFAAYMKSLLARKDLLWVEPYIHYVPEIKSDKVRY
jgi:hypothetical protein